MSEPTEILNKKERFDESICQNCHAKVTGAFCSQCGQSIESTLKYFWSVLLHLLDDIFSFDSRVSRTLAPLLSNPGFLTKEYFLGRRVHYVPPLRLYLFVSIIFFLALSFFAGNENSGFININNKDALQHVNEHITVIQQRKREVDAELNESLTSELQRYEQYQQNLTLAQSPIVKALTIELVELELQSIKNEKPLTTQQQEKYDQLKTQLANAKLGKPVQYLDDAFSIGNNEDGSFTFDFLSKENNAKLASYVDSLEDKARKTLQSDARPLLKEAIGKLPQLMFILLPIFALLLKIIYLFSKRLYLEHLTVALHSHSFIFLIILLLQMLDYLQALSLATMPSLASTFGVISVMLLVWLPVYLFIMQKRIYRQNTLLTLLKFSLIGISYLMLISFTSVVAFIWGLTEI